MKKEIQNQIISELINAVTGSEQIQINIVVSSNNDKTENVLINYERREDKEPVKIIERTTKNGYAWAASLILTLAKIKWFNTNIIIINDGQRYLQLT